MSNTLYIEHNPFKVETIFEVNGNPPDNIPFLEQCKSRRLQLWIEQLFPSLYNLFNGATHFDVTFKGIESDFIDLEEAAKVAKEQHNMTITLKRDLAEDSQARLDKVQTLMKEAEKHPIFGDKIKQSGKIRSDFEAAFNKDFDVYVAATMSAGKSTLINAMLGTDLLPAANEATTATIAQITDNDAMETGVFEGYRLNKDGEVVDPEQRVNLEVLKEWNAKTDTKLIKLEGNIVGIKERENVRLVITDTPGPNNSQDPEHSRTTMGYIQDSIRNPLILYILNATQLGTNDDQQVLSEIARKMQEGGKQAKDRFIFVVNKMDQFDPESGENVQDALGRVRRYLENNGIENPLIYPVSANLTRLLRKQAINPDSLTRKERGDLNGMIDLFSEEPSMDFIQYMTLTSSARRNLKEKKLPMVLERSGLPAIESMIDEYIDKYNLPNRVKRAYDALSEAIRISSNEAQLVADLKDYAENAKVIEGQLAQLKDSKKVSAKAKTKMEAVINDKKSLYAPEIIRKVDEIEGAVRGMLNHFQDNFVGNGGELTKKSAERKLKTLTQDINFESGRVINNLEAIVIESQEITRTKLTQVFDQYVKELFADLDGVQLPILEGLRNQVSDIASLTGLGLDEDEISVRERTEKVWVGTKTKRVRTGSKTVKDSSWWNPFSWGRTKEVDVYEDREVDVYENQIKREEFVDADELWENREADISEYFNTLTKSARQKIQDDVQKYAHSFTEFMENEFNVKLAQIVDDLNAKLKDKDQIEAQIKKAKNTLAEINNFKEKLDKVLAL